MSKNHDYQNDMSKDTKAIDAAGETAAEHATAENFAAGTETVREDMGNGQTHIRDVAKFGMLPTQEVPTSYAAERQLYFAQLSEKTRVGRSANGTNGAESAAYKSQNRLMEHYQQDTHDIPRAQGAYNMLVPLANMAARSYVKANTVSDMTGFDSEINVSEDLNAKEKTALHKGVHDAKFDQGASLAIASKELQASRKIVVGASQNLAKALNNIALKRLGEEKSKTEDEKAAIQAKIAKVTGIIGHIESAGSMIAGGAGFVNGLLPGGQTAVMEGDDLKSEGAGKVEKVGGGIEKGGGIASKIVGAGMEFYYQGEMDRLDAHIAMLSSQIGVEKQDAEYNEIHSARNTFNGVQEDYGVKVEKYSALIEDRRRRMAEAGHAADTAVDPKGGNHSAVGDRMEWATVSLELQSFLATSMEAGKEAQSETERIWIAVDKRRKPAWGMLSDAVTGSNTPNHEPKGPDQVVLRQMADLTRNWMIAAQKLQIKVDKMVTTNINPMLENAGYSGKY